MLWVRDHLYHHECLAGPEHKALKKKKKLLTILFVICFLYHGHKHLISESASESHSYLSNLSRLITTPNVMTDTATDDRKQVVGGPDGPSAVKRLFPAQTRSPWKAFKVYLLEPLGPPRSCEWTRSIERVLFLPQSAQQALGCWQRGQATDSRVQPVLGSRAAAAIYSRARGPAPSERPAAAGRRLPSSP